MQNRAKDFLESAIRVRTAGIDAHLGLGVLAPREDGLLEREAIGVFDLTHFFPSPHLLLRALRQVTIVFRVKDRHTRNVVSFLKFVITLSCMAGRDQSCCKKHHVVNLSHYSFLYNILN